MANKAKSRYDRKMAKRKLFKNLTKDPRNSRKTYKKHG